MTAEQTKVMLRWLLLPIWGPFWIGLMFICGIIAFGSWLMPGSDLFGHYLREAYLNDFFVYPARALRLIRSKP